MRSLALLAACAGLAAGPMTCLTAGCAHAQISPELKEIAGELDALAAEIQLIQDLNTLQLSREQIEQLIPAVEALRQAALGAEQQRVAVLRQLRPLMQRKRDLLLADAQPPEDLEAEIAALEGQLSELGQQTDEALLGHAATFREILSDPQVSIVTGEEEARRQVVELLEWVREMDDEAFEREAPPYAEELADPDVGLGEEEILDLFTLARAMDADQYTRSAPEIQGKLIELFRPTHETADRIIVSVFLHEAMPGVLQAKLALVTGQ
ncbi:MAG: hypothetical protein AB7Y46_02545 [Armatimonadota bacterium]